MLISCPPAFFASFTSILYTFWWKELWISKPYALQILLVSVMIWIFCVCSFKYCLVIEEQESARGGMSVWFDWLLNESIWAELSLWGKAAVWSLQSVANIWERQKAEPESLNQRAQKKLWESFVKVNFVNCNIETSKQKLMTKDYKPVADISIWIKTACVRNNCDWKQSS